MDASNDIANATKVDPDGYSMDEDVDLTNITPMPKHVFLNTLPGHLAPFPTIPRSRYDTDRNQREFYGQESFLNAFITSHCRDHTSTSNVEDPSDRQQHHPNQQQLSRRPSNVTLKRNQCSLCLRVFANSASLKQHMRLHRGEKPFKCRFCEKTSATMCNILTHERTHTRERPYKCTVCGADFSSSSNLKTHMRTHSGDRPFRCNLCDRRFVTSNALTTHLRAHWGLRLHTCPECDRQFSTSSNLRVHHRTVHLGIKQYHCVVCGKAFATSSNLNAHSRQHPESAYLVKYNGSAFCSSAQPSSNSGDDVKDRLNHSHHEVEHFSTNGLDKPPSRHRALIADSEHTGGGLISTDDGNSGGGDDGDGGGGGSGSRDREEWGGGGGEHVDRTNGLQSRTHPPPRRVESQFRGGQSQVCQSHRLLSGRRGDRSHRHVLRLLVRLAK